MFNVHVYVMYEDRSSTADGYHTRPSNGLEGEPPTPSPLIPTALPVYVWPFQESYEIRSISEYGSARWHPFSHYKRSGKRSSGTLHSRQVNDAGYWFEYQPPLLPITHYWRYGYQVDSQACWLSDRFGPADIPLRNCPQLYSIQSGELLIPPPNDLDTLLLNASQRLLPGVKNELSLINSIIELKDFKSLGHTFNNVSHLLDYVMKLVSAKTGKSFRQYAGSLTSRELVRKKSDIYLQYKFNIAPLVSDMQGIFKSLRTFQSQANRLVSKSAHRQTRHCVIAIDSDTAPEWETDDPRTFAFPGTYSDMVATPHRLFVLDPAKFHVEIQYSFHYTEFQKQHAASLALLDKLGVNFDPAIIWNAIPWSFTVDWVLGIGRYLHSWKTANLEPVIDIHRALWSIKRKRRIICNVDGNWGQKGVPVSFVQEEAYRRSPFVLTPHLIESSGLSLTEVSLAGALLGSRR
jgi:hypothetical protein